MSIEWEKKGNHSLTAEVAGRKFRITKRRGEAELFIDDRQVGGASNVDMAMMLAEGMVKPNYNAKEALKGVWAR